MTDSPPTVLIVEDEALVREIVVLEFRDAGYMVVEAPDGDTAVELLEAGVPVDLLFTDIRLPGARDGFDIAETARQMHPELPVIYATGFTSDELRFVPGSRFFKKPYWPQAVIRAAEALGVGPPRN